MEGNALMQLSEIACSLHQDVCQDEIQFKIKSDFYFSLHTPSQAFMKGKINREWQRKKEI